MSAVVSQEWSAASMTALLQLVSTLQSILSVSQSFSSLQALLVEARFLDALLNVLQQSVVSFISVIREPTKTFLCLCRRGLYIFTNMIESMKTKTPKLLFRTLNEHGINFSISQCSEFNVRTKLSEQVGRFSEKILSFVITLENSLFWYPNQLTRELYISVLLYFERFMILACDCLCASQ